MGKARGHGLFRRDLACRETGDKLTSIKHGPDAGGEQCLSQQGVALKSGVVVGGFAQAGEGSFRDNGFNARIDGCRLQRNARAHRFAKREEMQSRERVGRASGRKRRAHLDGDVLIPLGSE